MDSRTDVAVAGTFGYRFSRVVSLDIETTLVPHVRSPFPLNPVVIQSAQVTALASAFSSSTAVQLFPTPSYGNPGGRTVMFTNSVRVEIPTTASTLTPYFTTGGGIASVRRTADFTYPIFLPLPQPAPGTTPPNVQIRTTTEHITSSSTNLVLTLGGGLSIKVASTLSLDADLRVFRLLGDDDRNLGRFGVGVRYRF
jgi:hypothetical protein